MKHINSFMAVLAAATLSLAISCSKEPSKDYSINASVQAQDFSGVTVGFTAGENITSIKYACGSIFDYYKDSTAFANNVLAGQQTISAAKNSFKVNGNEGEPIVIYMRGVQDDGNVTAVSCLKSCVSPVAYSVSKLSLGSFVYTVPEDCGEYAGISMLVMSKDTPAEWGMAAEEIVAMYADYGMLLCAAAGESAIVELNGEPDYAQILAVVYWNADYTYSMKLMDFTSGSVIANAPEAAIDVTIENITAETADIVFAPNAYTCGYFYKLYKKADYEEEKAAGEKLGINGEEYVRDLAAAGGSFNYEAYTDSREGLAKATDYVLACFPYNVNGTQGWGESEIVEFTTAE